MPSSDLMQALSSFQQGVRDLQTSRALGQANEMVTQIKSSEAKDEEKTAQLRQVAEQLTLNLAQYGHPLEAAKAVATTFAPEKPPLIQSFEQAMVYGSDKQKDQAREGELFQHRLKMEEIAAKAKDGEGDPMKGYFKNLDAFKNLDKITSVTDKARGAEMQASKTIQRGQALQALLQGKTSLKDLDEKKRIEVIEGGSAFAQMVNNGSVTEGELKAVLPDNVNWSKQKWIDYFTSRQGAAHQGEIMQLYNNGARREAALAQQQLIESTLSHFTSATGLARHPNHPENEGQFREMVATKLNQLGAGIEPKDVIITPNGKVTTADQQAKDDKLVLLSRGAKEAKLGLNSADPEKARQAKAWFDAVGVNPKAPLPQISQVLKFRVLTGEI